MVKHLLDNVRDGGFAFRSRDADNGDLFGRVFEKVARRFGKCRSCVVTVNYLRVVGQFDLLFTKENTAAVVVRTFCE